MLYRSMGPSSPPESVRVYSLRVRDKVRVRVKGRVRVSKGKGWV